MKRKVVKGFTLIELIVVIAIFSIILFAATSMMIPVQKIMGTTAAQENANAAATNASLYLKNNLAPAEYMYAYSTKLEDADIAAEVEKFTRAYYTGIVRDEVVATTSPIEYAKGRVHVLRVDNTNLGEIREWVYSVSFNPSDAAVTQIDPSTGTAGTFTADYTYPVNKAFYENYRFLIMPGMYATPEEFDTTWEDFATDNNKMKLAVNANINTPSAMNLTLKTISRYTCSNCGKSVDVPTDYAGYHNSEDLSACPSCGQAVNKRISSFVNSSSFALINIEKRNSAPVSSLYFVIDMVEDVTNPGSTIPKMVDRGSNSFAPGSSHTPILGSLLVDSDPTTLNGMTFIYSYGSEIDLTR